MELFRIPAERVNIVYPLLYLSLILPFWSYSFAFCEAYSWWSSPHFHHVSCYDLWSSTFKVWFKIQRNSWRRQDNRKTAPTVEFNRKEPSQPTRPILGAISKSQRKHVDICPFLRDQSVAIKTTLAKTQRLLVSAVSEWVLGECGQECGPGSQTVRQHRQAGGEWHTPTSVWPKKYSKQRLCIASKFNHKTNCLRTWPRLWTNLNSSSINLINLKTKVEDQTVQMKRSKFNSWRHWPRVLDDT